MDAPLSIVDTIAHRIGESTHEAIARATCEFVKSGQLLDRVKVLLQTIMQNSQNEPVFFKELFVSSVMLLWKRLAKRVSLSTGPAAVRCGECAVAIHASDVNARDDDGYTPLARVLETCYNDEALEFLLDTLHADPNLALPNGTTPLMLAFFNCSENY